MEKVKCDLCQSDEEEVIFPAAGYWEYDEKFRVVRCRQCGLVFVNPRPAKEEINKFYPEERYWAGEFCEKDYRPIYRPILEGFPGSGKILDVGAGTGALLNFFKENGWQVFGNEVAKEMVDDASKNFGIKLEGKDTLEISFPDSFFEAIVFNNSLEHLYQPRETLMRVRGWLKPNGLLIVTVPNIESLGFKIFGQYWNSLQPPKHLYLFSPKTISKMLEKTGFKPMEVRHDYSVHNTYSLEQSLRFRFSPKFKEGVGAVLNKKPAKHSPYQLALPLFKIFGYLSIFILAKLEPILKKGEAITIYASKT